jgi:PAS domain S-box-containing protein
MDDSDKPPMHSEQVGELARRLAEAESALQALTAGQVDAVVDPISGGSFLLRQAQAELRRAHDELEVRVQERTAELERANAALRAEIAERQRAQAALRLYADRLEVFRGMDEAILAAHSTEEIAQIGLEHLERLLSCRWASVAMFDWKAEEVWLLATQIDGEAWSGERWRRPLNSILPIAKLREGQVQRIENATPLAPGQVPEGVRACLVVPLLAQGELIGTLNLALAGLDLQDQEQMILIQEVANQLAVGLWQVYLYDQVQRNASTLEQRVAERTAELRASEARIRAIFEQAGIGIVVLDRDGRLGESNHRLCEMTGYSEQELKGRPFADYVLPEEVETQLSWYRHHFETGGKAQPARQEMQFRRKDGQWRWANVTISLVRQATENPQFAIAMAEDITEQKQTLEALIHAEKLATTGRLAASLAHEINNPLQSVLGCLGLAEQQLAAGRDVGPYLQMATQELKRLAGIVAQLRDLNRQSSPQDREPVDLNALLGQVLALTRKQCQQGQVKVIWQESDDLPLLMLVPDWVRQVFLNLVLNAVEAMALGGVLRVSVVRTAEPPGVEVAFTDTGPGIAPENLSHVFDPFYTTKPKGLGLGLYVSHNIVEGHRGHIEVESRLGEGTTFKVWLPVGMP